MELFDRMVSMVGDNVSGGTVNKGLLQQAISMMGSPDVGGLSGLIEKFKNERERVLNRFRTLSLSFLKPAMSVIPPCEIRPK